MPERAPLLFGPEFASLLTLPKHIVVSQSSDAESEVDQFGYARIEPTQSMPPWPIQLTSDQAVIETYVIDANLQVSPTSDNEPYVTAWLPLVEWFATEISAALVPRGLGIDGDAFVTASLTPTAELEGMAHLDDDLFIPDDPVRVVAIIGQLAGPRVACGALPANPLRPMSQVQFSDATLQEFSAGTLEYCQAGADEIAIFPQFGQLHAGPSSQQVTAAGSWRQLLVFRATLTHRRSRHQ